MNDKDIDHFKFRDFDLIHDQSVMKTSTDSILLGAWTSQFVCSSVLDIGCGSGILSFMLAQRHRDALILGVDISNQAVELAIRNKAAIPFATHVSFVHNHFNELLTELRSVDLIICNPPYFKYSLLPVNLERQRQRHTTHFNFDSFASFCNRHLVQDGFVCMVIPYHFETELSFRMSLERLYLVDLVVVKHKHSSEPSLCLCRYALRLGVLNKTNLILFEHDNTLTPSFRDLTFPFLNFNKE